MTDKLQRMWPADRELPGASGTPAVLADGQTWLLADGGLCNHLDGLRDKLDADIRMDGAFNPVDVANMAAQLLIANYELTDDEVGDLIRGAVDRNLCLAVKLALFGQRNGLRTYTTWAASAMLSNGIDPASVPSSLAPHVLAQLEATGRCIPREEYIEAALAATKFAQARARAARYAPPTEVTVDPDEPPAMAPSENPTKPDSPSPLAAMLKAGV